MVKIKAIEVVMGFVLVVAFVLMGWLVWYGWDLYRQDHRNWWVIAGMGVFLSHYFTKWYYDRKIMREYMLKPSVRRRRREAREAAERG